MKSPKGSCVFTEDGHHKEQQFNTDHRNLSHSLKTYPLSLLFQSCILLNVLTKM